MALAQEVEMKRRPELGAELGLELSAELGPDFYKCSVTVGG
jgi:hypothetical protein